VRSYRGMAVKNFVLDTNVLLHDPHSILSFHDNYVNIPIVVIEEIDTFKRNANELGRNAREVARVIDALRKVGSLTEGVPLEDGGMLRVVLTDRELPKGFSISHQADNRIIATALHLKDCEPDRRTILVTLDTNLRIRANALGIDVEDFDHRHVNIDELYPGVTDLELSNGSVAAMYDEGFLPMPEETPPGGWVENQYVTVRDGKGSALARAVIHEGVLDRCRLFKEPLLGIKPRNREQHFALDACLRDDIKLVTLVGKAGTGKTLMALAAGLHKVNEENSFKKLLVSRPVFPMGRDMGHLPGELDKKLKPWMQPIYDNVEFLLGLKPGTGTKPKARGVDELIQRGIMEIEPLTYIRGRSIPSQYMVVDEAQNLTPHEIKTIITRAGASTKLVFTGDPYQIDNPYVDSSNNGLTYVVERFKGEKIAATVTLRKGERSELAELAANLL
jgi:PhoH-like ATPase